MKIALLAVASDIKIAHSIFALPFGVLAAFMAAAPDGSIEWSSFAPQLALIALAMVFGRTFAMLANRVLDREIDSRNPRTRERAIPSGRLTVRHALTVLLASAVLFIATTTGFGLLDGNWWPLALSVPVLAWIGAYGLFKRFTALCHFFLGSSLAISPAAAALAVDPTSLDQPAIWLLAGMVLLWVAGFDVIYALQDVEVDRAESLQSLPSQLGERGALVVSRVAHAGAVGLLVMTCRVDPRLGSLFAAAIAAVALLLVIEHATVARWGRTRMAITFFTLNGVISCLLGVLGVTDVLT